MRYCRSWDLLTALLFFCSWRTPTVEGIVFILNGQSIPNNNMSRISVYDFEVESSEVELSQLDTSLALRCQFERPNLGRYTRACISRDGSSPVECDYSVTEADVIQFLTRGWGSRRAIERSIEGNITRIHDVWRQEQASVEGYFSCHNFGSDTNDPAGLYILYPITKVTAAIEVVPGTSTLRVSCTSTGGRALNMAVSGPNDYYSEISSSIQPVGTRMYLGADSYTARTEEISSGRDGDLYQCNVTNFASNFSTVTLRVAVSTIAELRQTAMNSVMIRWTAPPGALVTGYIVRYRLASGNGGDGTMTVSQDSTNTETNYLTVGETYTFTVETTASNMLPGVSVGVSITVGQPEPPGGVVAAAESSPVTVSWRAVEYANRYTVTFSQVQGTNQPGLCPSGSHTVTMTVDGLTASIAVGEDVESSDDMLRAYTTYEVTVVTLSDVRGTSSPSDTETVTTPQTRAGEAPRNVSAEAQSSSEITVQWSGLTNCRLVNGHITRYRVLYTANNGDQEQSEDYTLGDGQNWMSGGQITLTGLSSSTNYSIAVAAVNENGDVGLRSESVRTRTHQFRGSDSDSLLSSCLTGIVVGVVVGILGVAVGVSGLIVAAFITKKYRPESRRKKGEMATEVNPAYGMSAPRRTAPPETSGDYEIPQFTQPP